MKNPKSVFTAYKSQRIQLLSSLTIIFTCLYYAVIWSLLGQFWYGRLPFESLRIFLDILRSLRVSEDLLPCKIHRDGLHEITKIKQIKTNIRFTNVNEQWMRLLVLTNNCFFIHIISNFLTLSFLTDALIFAYIVST